MSKEQAINNYVSTKDFNHLVEAWANTKTFDELLLHALIFGDIQESFTKTMH